MDPLEVSAPPIQRACGQCRFAELESVQGQLIRVLVCHRAPPGLFAIPAQGGMQMITQFPIVQPTMYCFEFQESSKALQNKTFGRFVKHPEDDVLFEREVKPNDPDYIGEDPSKNGTGVA